MLIGTAIASAATPKTASAVLLKFALMTSVSVAGLYCPVSAWTLNRGAQFTGGNLTGMKVVLLGTGTPNCEPERMGASLAVVHDGEAVLADCGPGVVRRLNEAKDATPELDPTCVCTCFLTHLHSDHTAGLPDLYLSPVVLGRTAPLVLFGPPGTNKLASYLESAYQADATERSHGLEPSSGVGYRIESQETEGGLVGTFAGMEVTALPAEHGSWPAFGYRFEAGGRTLVVSGDTAPYEGIEEAYAGADVLVHEVYSARGLLGRTAEWQAYHAACHTSSSQLAVIAGAVRPRVLVLTHQLFWGASDEELVSEVREGYGGEVVSGRDLDVFEV